MLRHVLDADKVRRVVKRPVVLVAALALLASLAACGSSRDGKLSFLVTNDRVAGFEVTSKTPYSKALHYFERHGLTGAPSRDAVFCHLTFEAIGLTMGFATGNGESPTPARCRFFEAVMQGSRWHTRNGLRVGDTAAAVRRLFPSAMRFAPERGGIGIAGPISILLHYPAEWLLNPRSTPQVGAHEMWAYTKAGRVIAFGSSFFI
jgi:hypothetical protein